MKDHSLQGSEMLTRGRGLCCPWDPAAGLIASFCNESWDKGGWQCHGGLFGSDHICICVQAAQSNKVVAKAP